ncbi:MAG: hypothetical protein JW959_03740 [Pirellulales bacterium]|nr:hypothetical protein [Pirellulales bacterium]
MKNWKAFCWSALIVFGLMGGLIVGGLWFQTPLHATATDRIDTYGMATGAIDSDVEAVYFLDFLTGDLRAVTLGKQPGTWTGFFNANVAADLGVDPQKNPKYLMVTGFAYLRRAGGSRLQPSNAMCYVAEVTSGKVAAYSIPWSKSMYAAGQMQQQPMVLVGVTRFRPTLGVGPGAPGGEGQDVPW